MRGFPLAVWGFAIGLSLLLSLPHLVASHSTPEGWQYSGALPVPSGFLVDYNSHLAKMWQGARGQWDYRLLFTHETHSGLFGVQGFYVALGAVSGVLNLDFRLAFHIARVLLTVGMVLALWRFVVYFFQRAGQRWLALMFGTLAMGWGWLLFALLPQMTQSVAPIEFWLIDGYNLTGALYMPHFAAAITLQIIAFLSYEAWRKQPSPREIAVLSLVFVLLALLQPYVILLLLALYGLLTLIHVFLRKTLSFRRSLWLLLPAGLHAVLVLYQYLAISSDPIWASFTEQNITHSPPVVFYLFGYLPFLLPIALGARKLLANRDERWIAPALWLLIVALLLYAPLPTQRRYLLGAQTPLAVLATAAWVQSVDRRLGVRRSRFLLIPYVALTLIAPLLLLLGNMGALSSPQDNSAVFYSADELQAAQWINANAAGDALILTSFDPGSRGTGGAVVALTGRRVYMGHWIETAYFTEKVQQLQRFYDRATSASWRRDFLAEIGAGYVWFDAEAQTFGTWEPEGADFLRPVLNTDTVTLYEVLP